MILADPNTGLNCGNSTDEQAAKSVATEFCKALMGGNMELASKLLSHEQR